MSTENSNLPLEKHSSLSKSSLKLAMVFSVVGLAFLTAFLYWFFSWRWAESTDNAYIKGDITPISSKVNGHVIALNVTEGDFVKEGQTLAQIDDKEYAIACQKIQQEINSADAALKQLPVQLSIQNLSLAQIALQTESAKANLEKDERAYERSKSLYKSDVSSVKDYDIAKANYVKSKITVDQLELANKTVLYNIELTKLSIAKQTAMIDGLKEQLKLAEIALEDTQITAPISGIIGNRSIRKGQYMRTGSIMLSIVPLDTIWIVANYKETQVSRFKEGQTVDFTVDAYPGESFQGKITSLNPASGAEFSLIPPENATGNFTKIVQRVPVKISIDNKLSRRLVPGMSVSVTVCTKNP